MHGQQLPKAMTYTVELDLLQQCQHWQNVRQHSGCWSNVDFQAAGILSDVRTFTEDLYKFGETMPAKLVNHELVVVIMMKFEVNKLVSLDKSREKRVALRACFQRN